MTTTSAGYVIKRLSVALLINRAALQASLGDKATPEAFDKQVKEIQQLVASAAGVTKDRDDEVKVSIVDFVDASKELEPVAAPSYLELLERQTGTIISAGAIVLVAGLLIWFGIRPVTRALLAPPPEAPAAAAGAEAGEPMPFGEMASALPMAPMNALDDSSMLLKAEEGPDGFLAALAERRDKGPQRQLQRLVDFDEEHAATILKQWIREGASA